MGCSVINRLLRLTLLTPDIQEVILKEWQPKKTHLEELTALCRGCGMSSARDLLAPDRTRDPMF